MANESVSRPDGSLLVSVGVDCGEAIKGFKALQRELKETIKDVKELEGSFSSLSLDGLTVKGGDFQQINRERIKFNQSARYCVIDFGEPVTNKTIEIDVKGYVGIIRTFKTDKL